MNDDFEFMSMIDVDMVVVTNNPAASLSKDSPSATVNPILR